MRRLLPFLLAFFAFPLTASITGTVIGPDGAPVAKARVQAFQPEIPMTTLQRVNAGIARIALASATTDDAGAFKLEVRGGVVDVIVEADAFTPAAMLLLADEQGVSIALTKGRMIEGTVTADGKPVAGAAIVATDGHHFREVGKSDAGGKYRIPEHLADQSSVFAVHRDFASIDRFKMTPGVALRGKVVDDHDQPVANATVVNVWTLVTTGEDGSFVIPHGTVGAELRARSSHGFGVAIARNGENIVRLKRLLEIRGVLRDEAKNPIAGLPVFSVNDRQDTAATISDAKGAFVLAVLPGKHWLMPASGPSFAAEIVETTAGATSDLKIIRLAGIDGTVRDDDGKPVAGARVSFAPVQEREFASLSMRSNRDGVPTDAAGRFRLRVNAGAKGRLSARKDAMPTASTDVLTVAAGGVHDVVVKLARGIEVKGVVTDGHGHALGGVSITQAEDAVLPFERESDAWATTAADGTFSVRLKEGGAALVFAKKGFVDTTEAIEVTQAMRPLTVAMSAAATVRGRLLNKDGTPAAEHPIGNLELQAFTNTKADGTFELDFPEPGDYPIQTAYASRKHIVHAPSSDVRIVLDEGLSIRGRVTDAVTGEAVERFTVTAERDDDMVGAGESGADPADFVIKELEPGSVTVVVAAEHYLPVRVEAEAGQTQPLAITLSRGLTLRGRVHDPAGLAIEGVSVLISRDSMFRSYGRETPVSAADGTFELDGLAPDETITLMFRKDGYVDRSDRRRVTKENGPVDVVLTRGLTIKGRVVDAEGKPASAVTVVASTAAHGSSYRDAKTGVDGAFEMRGLVAGRYDFEVGSGSATSGAARDVDIELVRDVTIRVERKPAGTIAGRVRGVNATTFMRMLEVHTPDGGMQGEINADGSFRVENVPAGVVQVSATLGGMNGMRSTRSVSVDVIANAVANVELALEEQRTLRGRVTRNGQPVAKANVTLSGSGYGSAHAPTGDDGMYEIHADPGRYSVNVEGLPYRGEVDLERTSVFDIAFNGILARARVIDGETGTPIEGALVQALMNGTHSEQESKTNAAGIASIELPRGEKATLIASKSGYANASADAVEGEVVMNLVRSTGAVVRLIDARDGRTLSGYVVARDAAGRVIASAHETEGDGTSMLAVPPGEYRFSASAEEYGSETIRASVPSAELRIALPRGGKLLLRSNEDLRGTARLLLPDGDMYVRCWCSGIADIEIKGRMTTVEAVSPGSYTLEVAPAGGKVRRYPVTVIQGETVPVQID